MATNASQPRSAWQQTTYRLQHSARKNMGSMLGRGIGLTIGGLLVTIVAAVAVGLAGGNFVAGIAVLLGIGFLLSGLFMLGRAVFTKRRAVTCPYCRVKRTLFRNVRSYVCDSCGHVLRFSGDGSDLVKVTCPYCVLEWAASPDSGATRCFSCGARLTLNGGSTQFLGDVQPCPACAAHNPEGSYFCRRCGVNISPMEPVADQVANDVTESIKVEPNSEGLDFITLRAVPPIGLLYRAVSHLGAISAEANELPAGGQLKLSLLYKVQDSLQVMEESLSGGPEYAESVRGLLPGVTRLTARLLKDVKIGAMPYSGTQNYDTFFAGLSLLFNRVAGTVNPEDATGEICWPTRLVKVSRGRSVGGQPPQFATVIDNEPALKDWVNNHLPDGPLTPPSMPARSPDR